MHTIHTPGRGNRQVETVWLHINVVSIDTAIHSFQADLRIGSNSFQIHTFHGDVKDLEKIRTGPNRLMVNIHIKLIHKNKYVFIYDMDSKVIASMPVESLQHSYSDAVDP